MVPERLRSQVQRFHALCMAERLLWTASVVRACFRHLQVTHERRSSRDSEPQNLR